MQMMNTSISASKQQISIELINVYVQPINKNRTHRVESSYRYV